MDLVRNLSYRPVGAPPSPVQTLDVYYDQRAVRGAGRPIVAFIHGGRWTEGDKDCFGPDPANALPAWFVDNGCVFASLNFALPKSALTPKARVGDMAADIARGLKWLTVNGRRYGGMVKEIVLVGFSSGAHLAALVACDPRYLAQQRFAIEHMRGVICMDAAHYDVPEALGWLGEKGESLPQQRKATALLKSVLGRHSGTQARWSPANYIGPHLAGVSFLLLSAGRQPDGKPSFSDQMSALFCNRLADAGVHAAHRNFRDASHSDFLGKLDGAIEREVSAFLDHLSAAATLPD